MATYSDLQADIASWLNRDDLTAQIPTFIRLNEAAMNRQLRLREMLMFDTSTVDEDRESLPADFLELKSIWFNTNPITYPDYATPGNIQHHRTANHAAGGAPRYYTIVGNELLFDRVPTGGPELEIISYVKNPALTDDNPESNLLDLGYDVYLYGSLIHAEPFLKNDERLQTWAAMYAQAKADLIAADRAAEFGAGPLVMRPKRSIS